MWHIITWPHVNENQHIVPCGDLIKHSVNADHPSRCVCNPNWQLVRGGRNGVVWQFVHSAMDDRE